MLGRLERTDGYRRAAESPKALMFRLAVAAAEVELGQGWRPALKAATGGGIAVAFDPRTEGAAVLVRAKNPETLRRLTALLVRFARDDARRKGKPDPVAEDMYRGVAVYRVGDLGYALHDGWLVATNKADLGQFLLDRLLDGGGATLAGTPRFAEARERVGSPAAWAYVDMDAVRGKASEKGPLATGRTENAVAELLAGDLRFRTDFREVYAAVLERWVGWPSEPVLGGRWRPADVIAG